MSVVEWTDDGVTCAAIEDISSSYPQTELLFSGPSARKIITQESTIRKLVNKLDEAIDLLDNTFYYSFDESVRIRAGEAADQWRLFLAELTEEGKLP